MIDYVNQFLFLYMVPFIVSYLYIRSQFKDRSPNLFDIFVVVTPFVNWITVLYFIMDKGAALFIEILFTAIDWSEEKFEKSNIVKRFFRIKD